MTRRNDDASQQRDEQRMRPMRHAALLLPRHPTNTHSSQSMNERRLTSIETPAWWPGVPQTTVITSNSIGLLTGSPPSPDAGHGSNIGNGVSRLLRNVPCRGRRTGPNASTSPYSTWTLAKSTDGERPLSQVQPGWFWSTLKRVPTKAATKRPDDDDDDDYYHN